MTLKPEQVNFPLQIRVGAFTFNTMPKAWRPPRDPERSFKTRTEGMMRKAISLTNLETRVAIYIERQGQTLQFKTHDFTPDWNSSNTARVWMPADLDRGPELSDLFNLTQSPNFRQETPATTGYPNDIDVELVDPQLTVRSDDSLSDSFKLFDPSLQPVSSPPMSKVEPNRQSLILPQGRSSEVSTNIQPQATATWVERKRRRPTSTPSMSPGHRSSCSPQRKRARTASWFDL